MYWNNTPANLLSCHFDVSNEEDCTLDQSVRCLQYRSTSFRSVFFIALSKIADGRILRSINPFAGEPQSLLFFQRFFDKILWFSNNYYNLNKSFFIAWHFLPAAMIGIACKCISVYDHRFHLKSNIRVSVNWKMRVIGDQISHLVKCVPKFIW